MLSRYVSFYTDTRFQHACSNAILFNWMNELNACVQMFMK